MEPDWDLHAVVRGFAAINKSSTSTVDVDQSGSSGGVVSSNLVKKQADDQMHHGDCSSSANMAAAEMHELCTPSYLLDPRQTQSAQPTISSYLVALQAYKNRTQHKGNNFYGTSPSKFLRMESGSSAATPPPATQKLKKRKKHQKKICHVTAEGLSSDVWSWRKYGQKPIKGSPYPRSYYKCSSSKACLARKQVERNRSDPNMFIVTFTAEHNHPAPTHKNCLAGTTRNPNSLAPTSAAALDESNLPTSKHSSSSSMATMSPGGSLGDEVLQQSKEMESMTLDTRGYTNRTSTVDDVLEFLNMDVGDGFCEDLEKLSGSTMGWFSPDHFSPRFPWIDNNVSSTGDMK